MVLHGLFYFTDRLPLLPTLFSIICHLVYLQNFSNTWPLISLTSITFLSSCVLVIGDHFIWFFYFTKVTNNAHHLRTYRGVTTATHSFAEIASFFGICVWFTPLYLFLSLSANDNALPTTTGKLLSLTCPTSANSDCYKIAEPSSPSLTASTQTGKARISLVRSIFSFFSFEGVSRIRQTRGTSEGLIAPRSPALPPSLSPPSPRPRSHYLTPPPRSPRPNSPGPDLQEIELHSSPKVNSEFKLDNTTPARRRFQPNQRMGDAGTGMSSRSSGRSLLVDQ